MEQQHDLVQEIREIRKISTRKRRSNMSKRDYLKMKAGNRCTYCRGKFHRDDLNIVKKNHTLKTGEIFENERNHIVSCKKCARLKSDMNHVEFLNYIRAEKKRKKRDIVNNYPKYARQVFSKYKGKCIYCEFEHGYTPEGLKLTIDHKIPVGQLGDNDEKNLACSCQKHNEEKGNHTPEEYFSYLEWKGRKHTSKKKSNTYTY